MTSLCQNINLKIVEFMAESGKKIMEIKAKKGTEKISFHLKVYICYKIINLVDSLMNYHVLTRVKEFELLFLYKF